MRKKGLSHIGREKFSCPPKGHRRDNNRIKEEYDGIIFHRLFFMPLREHFVIRFLLNVHEDNGKRRNLLRDSETKSAAKKVIEKATRGRKLPL